MEGVVFDFDGVLADSMAQHVEAYRKTLAPLGVEVQARRVYELEGARSEDVLRILLQEAGHAVAAGGLKDLADVKQRTFRSLGTPSLYAGVTRLLGLVQGRMPCAVVTGTRRANVDAVMGHAVDGFDAVVSQEAYTHSKPHPEPYLRAAAMLEIAPASLLCLENAPRGLASALAAGYGTVWAVATTLEPAALGAAHRVFADIPAAHEAIEELLA